MVATTDNRGEIEVFKPIEDQAALTVNSFVSLMGIDSTFRFLSTASSPRILQQILNNSCLSRHTDCLGNELECLPTRFQFFFRNNSIGLRFSLQKSMHDIGSGTSRVRKERADRRRDPLRPTPAPPK